MNYPQFRKYPDEKVFFKITGDDSFWELIVYDEYYFYNKIMATTYAEKLRIQDMIKKEGNFYLDSTKDEFESIHESCMATKTRKDF